LTAIDLAVGDALIATENLTRAETKQIVRVTDVEPLGKVIGQGLAGAAGDEGAYLKKERGLRSKGDQALYFQFRFEDEGSMAAMPPKE
jgi:hypothetical protein